MRMPTDQELFACTIESLYIVLEESEYPPSEKKGVSVEVIGTAMLVSPYNLRQPVPVFVVRFEDGTKKFIRIWGNNPEGKNSDYEFVTTRQICAGNIPRIKK
ncbi:MAG: hypothetical protein US74_C0012G0007 [Parcubacteria group bacterium GW2011_GWA2_38_13]|nr:MAG: hypothetical protein US74_C0012G0007 [Parcubacteria group bacterium GW2011_GWA2_38_13]